MKTVKHTVDKGIVTCTAKWWEVRLIDAKERVHQQPRAAAENHSLLAVVKFLQALETTIFSTHMIFFGAGTYTR